MKNKSILIIFLILILSASLVILTGCGEKNKEETISENNNIEQQVVQNSEESATEKIDPRVKIADTWMKMPSNVNIFWRMDVKNSSDYSITRTYKRGNDIMVFGESFENGVYITTENDGITNEYYFYHHQGDYIWTSYCYFSNEGWDNWYYKGNYPSSPQSYCFGRPWNILDNYSDNHVTITIEGIGDVDTVTGVDDEGYTYYYSKDLGFNVKIENVVQTWYLTSFDTTVTPDFPRALPDIEALDKLRELESTSAVQEPDDSTSQVIEGEDGELIVYDD